MPNIKNEHITCEKSRVVEIAKLVSKMPEREQEKIYYIVKCAELFGSQMSQYATSPSAI